MTDRLFGISIVCLLISAACQEPAPPPEPLPPPEPRADYEAPIGPEQEELVEYHVGEIKNGDSLSTALARQDVSAVDVDAIVRALSGIYDFRYAQPGHWFEIKRNAERVLTWFRYYGGPTTVVIAYRGADGQMYGVADPIRVRTATVAVAGEVSWSLYAAMEAQGETPWLTLALVDLFAWDIDFFTETQTGDAFRVVVQKRFVDQEFIGYGEILAAEYAFATGTRTHRAFRYQLESGKVGYYQDDGKAVEKTFLKSPIKFASITSRYGMRRHPILKYVRAHRGVDYGAPMGTAVWTVGEGVISFAGTSGGYGRVLYVRHRNGLETRYAHLNGFARGMRSGVRVQQKQVIGYVGKSGLATGPHLHFEVLRNGRHANPLSIAAPPAPPIPPGELERFMRSIAAVKAELDGRRTAAAASAASLP